MKEQADLPLVDPAPVRCWVAVALLFVFAATWGMTSFGLQDNNEGIYAEIGREMAAGGDWIIPHLNFVTYIEKPPLLYWCIATSLKFFGDEEWAVRLVPILFFGGTITAVASFGFFLQRPGTAMRACVILATAGGFVAMNRSLLFDVPLLCLTSFALLAFYKWLVTESRFQLRLFYVLLGCAVMTKGAVPIVLAGGTAFLTTLYVTRSRSRLFQLFDPLGIVLFFALVLPWHLLASAREPTFARFYFINEHVLRFLDKRVPRDYYTGPFYYYLVRLPLYLGFWVLVLPLIFKRKTTLDDTADPQESSFRAFLWIWFLINLVFFSISKAKANYYLINGMPPLALLLGLNWPRFGKEGGHRRLLGGSVVLLLLTAALPVAWILFSRKDSTARLLDQKQPGLVFAVLFLLNLLAIATVIAATRRETAKTLFLFALVGLGPLVPAPLLLQYTENAISERAIADYINTQPPADGVVMYRDYEKLSSLAFYIKRPISVIDSHSDDLYFARTHGIKPELFPTAEEFRKSSNGRRIWLVVRDRHLAEARALFGLNGFHIVHTFGTGILLANW